MTATGGWENIYFIAGSPAEALFGLEFVVESRIAAPRNLEVGVWITLGGGLARDWHTGTLFGP